MVVRQAQRGGCGLVGLAGCWLGGGGGEGCGSDGLEEVVDEGMEAEFCCCPVDSAAGEAAESEVVFGVGERCLGDVAALFVEGVAFGGA